MYPVSTTQLGINVALIGGDNCPGDNCPRRQLTIISHFKSDSTGIKSKVCLLKSDFNGMKNKVDLLGLYNSTSHRARSDWEKCLRRQLHITFKLYLNVIKSR